MEEKFNGMAEKFGNLERKVKELEDRERERKKTGTKIAARSGQLSSKRAGFSPSPSQLSIQ